MLNSSRMKMYPEEWDAAVLYSREHPAPLFSIEQRASIHQRIQVYNDWLRRHHILHNVISFISLGTMVAGDAWVLVKLPEILREELGMGTTINHVIAGIVCCILHGFFMYAITNYSMHEGASHNRIFLGSSPFLDNLRRMAHNLCRFFFADPEFYASTHIAHHAKFATKDDADFTHCVRPDRIKRSLLPFAATAPFNDYKIHMGLVPTSSSLLTFWMGLAFIVFYMFILVPRFGWMHSLSVLLFFGPWVAFILDRLRETTDHGLMALDTIHGSRSLGLGPWGLFIGGGPWGQPCHLSHHLAPMLPWYQQIFLHGDMKRFMTREQKEYFLVEPWMGFPKLIRRILRENAHSIERVLRVSRGIHIESPARIQALTNSTELDLSMDQNPQPFSEASHRPEQSL